VWPAAAMQVGLQRRRRRLASIRPCFPHPIRPFGPPSPLRGNADPCSTPKRQRNSLLATKNSLLRQKNSLLSSLLFAARETRRRGVVSPEQGRQGASFCLLEATQRPYKPHDFNGLVASTSFVFSRSQIHAKVNNRPSELGGARARKYFAFDVFDSNAINMFIRRCVNHNFHSLTLSVKTRLTFC
jgi:hypothetical protein